MFILLFFVSSCKDEDGIVGFKKDPRLNSLFIDIPLDPSVIQNTGILTDNPASEVVTRILFGRYNDPLFGKMEARGYMNFAPPPAYVKPSTTATFDSLVFQMNFDYYYYGQTTTTQQTVQLYEVLDTIKYLKPYYASTPVAIGSTPLAQTSFYVSGDAFDNALVINNDADTSNNQIFNVRMKIPGSIGPNLLDNFKGTSKADSAMIVDFNQFSGKYKGFALVVPDGQGDKILGINPIFRDGNPMVTDTKISLYYTDQGVQSKADFVMYQAVSGSTGYYNPVLSFSKILTDRIGTPLAGIKSLVNFQPSDGRYYIQAGTSLVTKLDLKNFYNFIDTVDHIAFNQAQLIVTNVSTEKPPVSLSLRVLDSTNHFRTSLLDTMKYKTASSIIDIYFQKTSAAFNAVNTIANTTVTVIPDTNADIPIDPGTYIIDNIYLTSFCQSVYKYKTDKRRPTALALSVASDNFRKSVSGLVLDKNISLRIYYSKPVIKIR